ncbi:MAG: tRNA uridine-5-carboxymethylaminomethyl(34) synthesis GTPase MnmE [Oscillospiraceae bacterium]|nr:tRNA uridine-5-carboxymethylaminomethyl(34) synthesis GTPase MnmE [Oscillospiraceae bacterium]
MDTIAAIATPLARSAFGIIRLSGPDALRILDKLFHPVNGRPVSEARARSMVYGSVCDSQGRVIDHPLAVWFAAGKSYTGDVDAEIHCHGSPVVLNEVLAAAFAAGARQAKPGEFAKRAFLNGKLDLTEAEAIVDLVDAETAEAARNAALQVDGALRRIAEDAYNALLDITSRFYAVVDYPDEDVEDASPAETERTLAGIEAQLSGLLDTFARGRIVKSGVATAIIGAPNAGKSSLLNRLVGYERAIVTDVAGTTRDTVEEKAVVGGVLLRLVDTAGLRETDDAVEKLGVERSRKAVERSELILALCDGSRAATEEDARTLALAGESGKPWLLLRTKCDLPAARAALPLAQCPRQPECELSVSSVNGDGLDELEKAVAALFPAQPAQSGTLLTNARQADAAARALDAVRAAGQALRDGVTPDAVLTEVESAANALGELTGRTAREDMIERIFERFCVGK